jgi:hypothetical protein
MFKVTLLGLSITIGVTISASASAAIHIEQPTRTSANTRLHAQSLTPLKSSQPLQKTVIPTAKPASVVKNGRFVPIKFDRAEIDAKLKADESAREQRVQRFPDNSNRQLNSKGSRSFDW